MLRSGVQKRNRIAVAKPSIPVAIALLKIPFAATTLERARILGVAQIRRERREIVIPRIFRLLRNVSRGIKARQSPGCE